MDDGVAPRLLTVSHCLLNPFSQVKDRRHGKEAARYAVSRALQAGVGLLQLPCPEFTAEGPNRWAKTYEQYDTVYFRRHSRELIEPLVLQLREYLADGAVLVGVIGVEGSPSCGAYRVCIGEDWGGCFDPPGPGEPWLPPPTAKVMGRGVFLETLADALEEQGWAVPVLGVPPDSAPPEELETFRGAVELMMSESGLEALDGEAEGADPAAPADEDSTAEDSADEAGEAGEETRGGEAPDPWEEGDLRDWA